MNVIRYAYLDGKPVRLNDREAWWLVEVWKALHPADAGHDAKLISEEQFNSMSFAPLRDRRRESANTRRFCTITALNACSGWT